MGVSLQRGQTSAISNYCEYVEGAGEAWEVSVGRMQQRCMEELPGPFYNFCSPAFLWD